MTIVGPCVLLWLLVSVGLLQLRVWWLKEHPEDMPGGGPWAVAIVCIAWPVILVLAIVGLVLFGLSDL